MERHFEKDLAELKEALLAMAGGAESIVQKSIRALEKRDRSLAEEVLVDDRAIDRLTERSAKLSAEVAKERRSR